MKRYILLTMVLTILVIAPISAQMANKPFLNPSLDGVSLLKPNNLEMNHTLSFMSSFTSEGDGFYQSVYTNHLMYRFNPKLDLRVDINFVNYGTANFDRSFSVNANDDNTSAVMPEFSLNYRPTDNSKISIQFRQLAHPYSTNNWRW